MNRKVLIELFVIDAMADDYEDLEEIEKSVALRASKCGLSVTPQDSVDTLKALISRGFVKAYRFETRPEAVLKQYPFRGTVKHLDDQHRIATIAVDGVRPVNEAPAILQHPVKDPEEYADLKVGASVRGVVFSQYSDYWFGNFHDDAGDSRSSILVPFEEAIELPGVPSDDEIANLAFGLSAKGRGLQDSDVPGWPFDEDDVLIPGWSLEEG